MDFFEVVLNQRACRQFSDEPVDVELVTRCLEAAIHAPSAENRQPWVFVVVRDPAQRSAVNALTRRAWREGGRAHSESRLPSALMKDVDDGAETGFAQAPVLVVVDIHQIRGSEANQALHRQSGTRRSVCFEICESGSSNLLLCEEDK